MMQFKEYDGMILLHCYESTKERIAELKANGKWSSNWQFERGHNHTHTDMSAPDREHIRQELELAADFAEELRNAYPERAFVITHVPCYAVSFYQAEEGVPTEVILPINMQWAEGEAFCETCQGFRPFTPFPSPDAEFPQVEWGTATPVGAR